MFQERIMRTYVESSATAASLVSSPKHSYSESEIWRMVILDRRSFWDTGYMVFMSHDTRREEMRNFFRHAFLKARTIEGVNALINSPPHELKRLKNFLRRYRLRMVNPPLQLH